MNILAEVYNKFMQNTMFSSMLKHAMDRNPVLTRFRCQKGGRRDNDKRNNNDM